MEKTSHLKRKIFYPVLFALVLVFSYQQLLATQILPEVHDGIVRLQHGESVTASLPLGEICFIAGFSLAYLSEKLARWLKAKEIQNKINGSIQKLVGVGKSTQSYDDKIVPRHPNPDVVDTCEMNLCVQQLAKDYYKKSTTTSQIHLAIGAEQAVSSCNGIALGYHHQQYHHTIDDADRVTPSSRGILIVINLLLNEIFEGMAVGLEESKTRNLYSLFTTIAPHKLMIVFCVGLEMANSGVNVSLHILSMGMFTLLLSLGNLAITGFQLNSFMIFLYLKALLWREELPISLPIRTSFWLLSRFKEWLVVPFFTSLSMKYLKERDLYQPFNFLKRSP